MWKMANSKNTTEHILISFVRDITTETFISDIMRPSKNTSKRPRRLSEKTLRVSKVKTQRAEENNWPDWTDLPHPAEHKRHRCLNFTAADRTITNYRFKI